MEIKINKEIRSYSESIFFGLNMRQLVFSFIAIGIAVAVYFVFRSRLGTETVSWLCILGAAPFAALGFLRYNGMPAEKFVWAFIRSEILTPKKLVYRSTNLYYELTKEAIKKIESEGSK